MIVLLDYKLTKYYKKKVFRISLSQLYYVSNTERQFLMHILRMFYVENYIILNYNECCRMKISEFLVNIKIIIRSVYIIFRESTGAYSLHFTIF
ncbi:unnamed protein product, partial [Leptidea sinapis]